MILICSEIFYPRNMNKGDILAKPLEWITVSICCKKEKKMTSPFINEKDSPFDIEFNTIKKLLEKHKLENLRKIQKLSFNHIFTGRNVLLECETGGGKTLAYLLPVICLHFKYEKYLKDMFENEHTIYGYKYKPIIHIIVPTYELIDQISKILQRLDISHNVLAGSVTQLSGADFFLFTVGKYNQYMKNVDSSTFEVTNHNILILDEADKLLTQKLDIHPYSQFILVSATLKDNITKYLNDYTAIAYEKKLILKRTWEIIEHNDPRFNEASAQLEQKECIMIGKNIQKTTHHSKGLLLGPAGNNKTKPVEENGDFHLDDQHFFKNKSVHNNKPAIKAIATTLISTNKFKCKSIFNGQHGDDEEEISTKAQSISEERVRNHNVLNNFQRIPTDHYLHEKNVQYSKSKSVDEKCQYSLENNILESIIFHYIRCFSKLRIKTYFVLPQLSNLILLVQQYRKKNIIIFCNTVNTVKYIYTVLKKFNLNIRQFHGKISSRRNLKESPDLKGTCILITSGVMNRGFDFKGVKIVIEFEKGTADDQTHRKGRTGRDTKGSFIRFCKSDVPEHLELIFKGKKFHKKSHGKIKHSVLTNLLVSNENNYMNDCSNRFVPTDRDILFHQNKKDAQREQKARPLCISNQEVAAMPISKRESHVQQKLQMILQDKLIYKMALDALKSNIKYSEGNKIMMEKDLYRIYGLDHLPNIDLVHKTGKKQLSTQ